MVAVLLGQVVLGLAAGWLWESLWTPPTGFAAQGGFYLDGDGLRDSVSGTGIFVMVGAGAGLLAGTIAGLLRGDPRALLAALLLGAVLGVSAMSLVGSRLGPPDPDRLVGDAATGERLPANLEVVGSSPYLIWPMAALLAFLAFVLFISRQRVGPRPDGYAASTDPVR